MVWVFILLCVTHIRFLCPCSDCGYPPYLFLPSLSLSVPHFLPSILCWYCLHAGRCFWYRWAPVSEPFFQTRWFVARHIDVCATVFAWACCTQSAVCVFLPGAPHINGSAGPSSVNGIHTCKGELSLQLALCPFPVPPLCPVTAGFLSIQNTAGIFITLKKILVSPLLHSKVSLYVQLWVFLSFCSEILPVCWFSLFWCIRGFLICSGFMPFLALRSDRAPGSSVWCEQSIWRFGRGVKGASWSAAGLAGAEAEGQAGHRRA